MYYKIITIYLFAFGFSILLNAQKEADPMAKKFGQSITADDLKTHLSVLAADEYQGRETGEKGQKMAAKYIANHFKSLKLKKGNTKEKNFYQQVPLVEGSWDNPTIKIDGKEYKFLEDFYCFSSVEAMELEADQLVFVGYGIQDEKHDDYQNKDFKGKVLLVKAGEPQKEDGTYILTGTKEPSEWTDNWRKKLALAKKKGAKAMLMVDEDIETNLPRLKRYLTSGGMKLRRNESSKIVNTFYISPEMGKKLMSSTIEAKWAKKLKKRGKSKSKKLKHNLDLDITKKERKFESENVLGYLEGTDLKDELLVITAHYDHIGTDKDKIFNGADDDGSGTVAVLEIAEAFAKAKKAGKGPRRSILFMTVTGEEKGLLGSEFYVTNPIYPLENTIANLNIDMVGRTDDLHDPNDKNDRNYVYIIGSDRLSTELHAINEKANKLYTDMNLDYKYNDKNDPNRFYYRSDHYNFARNNIPIIFYFNGTHEDYHQATDTVDKIEFDMLAKRAQLIFYTAWQLVNQDKRIEVDVEPEEDEGR